MNYPPTIDTDEVKRMVETDSAQLIEVATPQEYERGHIPGAVHIYFGMVARRAAEILDKTLPVITYCKDTRCRASLIAAQKLQSLGYEPVYHYHGGKVAWTDAGYALVAAGDE